MATLPTTSEAIRDRIIAVIEGLVPATDDHVRFRASRNEGDAEFRDWCEANPAATRRRFQVRDDGDDSPPEVTNGDIERRNVKFVILVCYPQTGRDGKDQALDRDDTLWADREQIEHAVGMWGRANFSPPYPDACWLAEGTDDATRETGTACDFLRIAQAMTFVQTMALDPVASFTTSAADLVVTFTNTSTDGDGHIVSYLWDFGDSSSSTLANPVHTYAVGATYTVTLTVTDDDGFTDVSTSNISVIGQTTLTVSTDDSSDTVGAFSTFTYTFQVTNTGGEPANSTLATITLDAGVTWVSTSGTGWTIGGSGQTRTASQTALAVGAAAPIVVTVTAPNSTPLSTSVSVTASNATTVTDTETTNVVLADGPSNWLVPVTSAQVVAIGESAPDYMHLFQESSGNLADQIGNMLLTPFWTSTPPTYRATVAGWTRYAVTTIDGDSNNGFRCTNAQGPNTATESSAYLIYIRINGYTTAGRNLVGDNGASSGDVGSTVMGVDAPSGKMKVLGDANSRLGVFTPQAGKTIAAYLQYNRADSTFDLYTQEEKVPGFFPTNAARGGGGIGAGRVGTSTFAADANYFVNYVWKGTKAERTLAQIQSLFDHFHIARPWTSTMDGPNHVFLPTTAAMYSYLGIRAAISTYNFAATSGDLPDQSGTGFTLTAGSTITRNATAAEAGYVGKVWRFSNGNGNSYVRAPAGVGPDPSTTSVFMMALLDVTVSTNSSTRQLMRIGGATEATEFSFEIVTDSGGTAVARAKLGTNTVLGTVDIKTPSVMGIAGMMLDNTNQRAAIFTLDEIVPITWGAVTDGLKGLSTDITNAPPGFDARWLEVVSGSGAEMTNAQIRTRLQTLRHTVNW